MSWTPEFKAEAIQALAALDDHLRRAAMLADFIKSTVPHEEFDLRYHAEMQADYLKSFRREVAQDAKALKG